MTDDEKKVIKAEVTALIAYRYMGMFYRFGGVPKVTKSFETPDDEAISAKRETLENTLQYVLDLCDEALAVLPAKWDAANTGRMTQGAVLAIKAKALMFAARPLFNSATPYLDNGELNNLICFGEADKERWKDAIDANEDVLEWAAANGVKLINTGNPFVDYATATSTPANAEVILALKIIVKNRAIAIISLSIITTLHIGHLSVSILVSLEFFQTISATIIRMTVLK